MRGNSEKRRRRDGVRRTLATVAVSTLAATAAIVGTSGAAVASSPAHVPSARSAGEGVGAPGIHVTRDTAAKTIALTDGSLRMVLSYDGAARVSSFTDGSTQLLNAGLYSTAQLDVDGSTLDSRHLSADPDVTVRGDTVRVSFTMANADVQIAESWKFELGHDGINLTTSRTYDWLETSNTAIRHNGQLEIGWARVWDDIRRPEDGGDLPIGNKYAGTNHFFLSQADDRYGVEEGQFVLLSNDRKQAVAVTASSQRAVATEFAYTGDGNTYQETQVQADPAWAYTAGSAASGLVYGGHSSNDSTAYIYSPSAVGQEQQDEVSFHFATDDYDAYASLGGTINGVKDTTALASLLNEFGRSGIIDKGYGMSTVGLRYPGVGPYDMVYADRTVLGLYDPATTASQEKLLTFFKDNAQESNGHMRGRSFHRDYTWTANQLFDADPSYAMAVSDMYQYSGDTAWLKTMKSSVESALSYMLTNQYASGDGLFHNDTENCVKLHGEREWNDAYYVKYESGYVNELMYGALNDWAGIERSVFHDDALATSYAQTAAHIKQTFNKSTSDGGLWDPATGMFAYWRCPDGTVQGATEHTQINLQAIIYGLVDLPRARQILSEIDNLVAKNHLPLIPQNFIPMKANVEDWTGDHFQSGLEDGVIYPLMTEEYMRAAALVGERSQSLAYLNNTVERYTKDGFDGFSFMDWQLQPRFGEAWFPSNANGATGLFSDVLGIQPTAGGVTIAPNIPQEMNGTSVTRTIHANDKLTITYTNELTQVVSYRASGPQQVTLQWSGQEPGRSYTVKDGGQRARAVADAMGVVRYSYPAGQDGPTHTVSLTGGNGSGYVVKNTVSTDLALGKDVSASSSLEDGSFGAAKLTDGDGFSADGTWGFSSNGDLAENHAESVTVDLGSAQTVATVELDQRDYDLKDTGTCFPIDFTIETSTDGTHWSPGVTETGYAQPKASAGQTFPLTPRSARYVRVTGTNLRQDDSDSYRMQFAELQVYGTH